MAFVNEYIPVEDLKKYNIEEINEKVIMGSPARDWTIDRERDIYLRQVSQGREDARYSPRTGWTFYWKGRLLSIWLESLTSEEAQSTEGETLNDGKPDNPACLCLFFKLSEWSEFGSDSAQLPSDLRQQRENILRALKETLEASKGGVGIFASDDGRPCHVTLKIAEGV